MAEIDWSKATDDYLDGPNLVPPLGPRLVTNVGIASEIDSDYEAELKKVATTVGVPVDAVRSDPVAAKRKAVEMDPALNALPSTSPKTAKYVADNAAMAHDDIPALKFVEQRLDALVDLAKASGMGFAEGMIGFAGAINDIIDPLGLVVGSGSSSRAYADFSRQQLDQKIKDTMPQTSNVWEAGVNSGLVSLFQQSPLMAATIITKNPSLALGTMGAVTGGEAYGEAKDKGKSNIEALTFGAAQGGVEILTERLPINALIGDVAANSGFLKTLGKQLALEIPGEQVATAMQDLNEWAVLNPDRPFSEYLRERPNAALQTAVATVVGTGGIVSTTKMTDAILRQADRQRAAAKGLSEGAVLAEMDGVAAESKLRQRDAESFKAFMDQALEEGGPIENVYVPGDVLAQAIADDIAAGGDAAQITALLPSVQEQLAEAVRTGGDVQIPMSEWMAFASGSSLAQTLLPQLKTDPLGMSQAQAEAFMQEGAQAFAAEVEQVIAASEQVDAFQASADAVKAQVAAQLAAANRFTPDVNDAYAQLTAGFYATMAQRVGVTPEELYAANPVEIAAQGVELGSLAQEGIDLTPPTEGNALRAVRIGDTTVELDVRPDRTEIGSIRTPKAKRGRGSARAALNAIVSQADAQGVKLTLTASPLDKNTTIKGLVEFYRSAGFEVVRVVPSNGNVEMIREPQSLQQGGKAPTLKAVAGMLDRSKFGELRGLATPNGDLFFWDANDAIHADKAKELGIDYDPNMRLDVSYRDGEAVIGASPGVPRSAFERYANDTGTVLIDTGSGAMTGAEMFDGESLEQSARGSYNPASDLITLLKGADLSTFLHESGHFYIETLARLAAQPNAPEQIQQDFATAAGFMGHEGVSPSDWLMLPLDERREGHELFARGFEAYLFEGKAPAQRLRQIYQRFRSWLVNVYKNLTALNVELSDEVRGVFDRMLATDAEIERQRAAAHYNPLFTDPAAAGMSEAEWESYQRLGREATEEAVEQLEARSMRDMQWLTGARSRVLKELQKDARSKRKAVEAEVTDEVMAEPINRARQLLKRGLLDGQEFDGPHKLSIPALRDMYERPADGPYEMTADEQARYDAMQQDRLKIGREIVKAREAGDAEREGMLRLAMNATETEMLDLKHGRNSRAPLRDYARLGYGKYGMLAEDGVHPDEVADLFGFGSGDALVEQLLNAEQPEVTIEGMTDQRMLERYGDLADPDSISRAANEAIHNEARLRFAATEANALAKATGSRRVLVSAAKDYAAGMVARMKVRDLRPSRFVAAESRAAIAAERAAREGDLPAAAAAKRAQVVNGYATRATQEAQTEVERALRYFAGFTNASSRKNIDPDYRDQIDQLLARFDLRKGVSLRAIDKRKSLAAWVEAQKEKGYDPIIPDELLNETFNKHYKDMTVEELRGLVDSVRNIAHLGRLKNRLLTAKDKREFEAAVAEGSALIAANSGREAKDAVEANTWSDKAASGAREFLAMHRKFASLIRQMGGFKDRGLLWDVLVRPMNEASDKEALMREQSTMALHEIFAPIVKTGKLRQKLSVPGLGESLSLEGRLAIALNWGNELNRQRIMDGDRWTEEQVQAILGTLSAEHWTFVQKVWDYLDSYWPEIAAKERRVTGVEPQKVDRAPFSVVTSDGVELELPGGYYPLKYDTRRSTKAEADANAEAIKQAMQGAYTRATTRRGHTKQRAERVDRAVRKDFGVIFEHVTEVIHDLSWHEYLIDANRLIGAGGLDTAIRAHYGPEVLRTMRSALQDMAAGDIPATNAFERSVNHLRTGATIAGLGWNLTTALLQPLGLTQSVVRIGPKWVGRGISRIVGDAASMQNSVAWVHKRSTFMRLRAKTMQREINEIRNRVGGGKPELLNTVESSFFYMIAKMQLVADLPTWMGAYEKAKDQGENDDTAVALADQAVRDSQGGGAISDLSQIQRGGPLMKLWTNFYSFFNVAYNMMAESVNETRVAGPKRLPLLAADVLLLMVLPSVLGTILRNAMRGDDWDELPEDLIKDQLGYLLGLMVGLREVGSMVSMPGNYSSISGLRFASELSKLIEQGSQGEVDEAFLKSANNAAGILFHYPAGQVQRTTLGIQALMDGKSKNPMVIVTGPPRERP